MKPLVERHIDDIQRGLRTFDEIGNVVMKNEIADIFVQKYIDNTISEKGLQSLIDHYVKQITYFHRITIDNVPEPIRSLVEKAL